MDLVNQVFLDVFGDNRVIIRNDPVNLKILAPNNEIPGVLSQPKVTSDDSRFKGTHLPMNIKETVQNDAIVSAEIINTLDPLMASQHELNNSEIELMMTFLHALTSPSAADICHLIPESVPSGLPVWD